MQTTSGSQVNGREDRWEASFRAERQGDYATALEFHEAILVEGASSYAACMRSGWLCYRLKAYEEALRHYECARAIDDGEWPNDGIANCLNALGKSRTYVAEACSGSRRHHGGCGAEDLW